MDLLEARAYHLRHVAGRVRLRPGVEAEQHPTYRSYAQYTWSYLTYLEDHGLGVSLTMLNPQLVDDWLLWLRQKPVKGSRGGEVARAQAVRVLKVWAAFLWRRGVYQHNPLAVLEVPRVRKIKRKPYTQQEAQRLLHAVSSGNTAVRDRAVFLLLATTGCRVGELSGLDLKDVLDAEGNLSGEVSFRYTKNGVPKTLIYRNSQQRDGGRCMAALRQWLKVRQAQPEVAALFVTEDGWPLTARRVGELHTMYGRIAAVSPCHPHRWRHTNLSEGFAQGAREEEVRARAGHVSVDVLRDYLTLGDRTQQVAANRFALGDLWNL